MVSRVPGLPKGPKSCPRWSPDGLRVAFVGRAGTDAMYGTRNVDLFVHDFAARRTTCLTAGSDLCMQAATLSDSGEPAFDAQVRWFPDGTAIFFRAGWHGSGLVASVPAHGGPVAFHAEPGAEHVIGTFSADGWRLACVRSTPRPGGLPCRARRGARDRHLQRRRMAACVRPLDAAARWPSMPSPARST